MGSEALRPYRHVNAIFPMTYRETRPPPGRAKPRPMALLRHRSMAEGVPEQRFAVRWLANC